MKGVQKKFEHLENIRKRVLARERTEEHARRLIGRAISRTIAARLTHGPYGTRTLTAMRQFPGYAPPSLENYAAARRRIKVTSRRAQAISEQALKTPKR